MKNTLIFISVLLIGCKSHKLSVKSETARIDSVKIDKRETVFTPVLSKLTINDICDTITGRPRPFKSELVRGKDTVFVEVAGNDLKINVNLDSIVQSHLEVERAKLFIEKKETTKTKTVWTKWTWVFLSIIVVFLSFPVIPKTINVFSYKLWRLFF